AEDWIFAPGSSANTFVGKLDLLLQRPADGLDNPSLDLIDQSIGIDYQACIDRTVDLRDPDAFSYFNIGDNGNVRGSVLVSRKTDALAVTGAAFGARLPP